MTRISIPLYRFLSVRIVFQRQIMISQSKDNVKSRVIPNRWRSVSPRERL